MNKEERHEYYELIESIESDICAIRGHVQLPNSISQEEKDTIIDIANDACLSLHKIFNKVKESRKRT